MRCGGGRAVERLKMPRQIEGFWIEQQQAWWTSAFPFSRERFQAIWSDIVEEHYTSAEAIAKHLAAGSGIAPPEFVKLLLERYNGTLYRYDALEFQQWYTRPLALLQLAFVEVAHGAAAAAELTRQNPLFSDEFIQRNIHWAASLIEEDITRTFVQMPFWGGIICTQVS